MLDDISLDVAAHDVICLIGASGSGKSTLLRCINLLEPIDDGAILLDGDDISEPGLDPDPIRRRIGMVFQSFNLFPHMTVADNIALGADARCSARTCRRPDATAIDAARPASGSADKADAYPDQLSRRPAAARRDRPLAGDAARRSCCSTRSRRRSTPSSSARCSTSSAT